jgi:hypothetical protein
VPLERQLGVDRLGDVVVAPPVGGPFGVGELVHEVAAQVGRQRRAAATTAVGSSTRWHLPPWNSIREIFSGEVRAGITAMNGRPSIRAKYASLTAVEPEDASTTVVRGPIQPLHNAYRKSDLARRCLSEPVGCDDSSLR